MTAALRRGLVTLLLLAGSAGSLRAQQHTKNLGLLLGGQQYENQNWQRLDQAVCAGMPPLCSMGGVGNMLQAATAPFPCSATTAGIYTDTDCKQLCRCNPGQAKWCRSDTGACLTATDCCVPPTTTTSTTTSTTTTTTTTSTTTTTTSTTTTTTVAVGAPSWVPSMLAAWMLDEPSGTMRVNAQGTTSRNLTEGGGAVGSDATNKMEGTAAAVTDSSGHDLFASDTVLGNLISPLSLGCWVRPTATPSFGFILGKWTNINAILLDQEGTSYKLYIYNNSYSVAAGIGAVNTFTHLVGTFTDPTMKLYTNGVLQATGTAVTISPYSGFWDISDATYFFLGQVDECWVTNVALTAPDVCRICSCGVRGEQCTCSGTAYTSTGRNATACGSCTLPAACNQPTP